MDTMECIKSRRSIRRFTEQEISDEVLRKLLEAIRWAPSWANTQCWEIIVVKDQDIKEKLAAEVLPNNPATKGIIEAPVLIVACGKKGKAGFKKGEAQTDKGDWYMFDLGIACQNLCLAAHSLGLGTVHVGSLNHKGINKVLGLPEDVESVELIPVGYPAKEGSAPPRKELNEFIFIDRYGQKADI